MTVAPERPTHVVRADHVPGPPQGEWTYDDYAALPDDGLKYEIVEGVLYAMSPSAAEPHENANAWFVAYLKFDIQGKGLGRVYGPKFDVELSPVDVVQPDVVVVLNANLDIVKHRRIIGTPDLVIELASPSTTTYDRREKLEAYARAGVAEYWIPDPLARTIEVLRLINGRHVTIGVFSGDDRLPAGVLPQLDIAVSRFFA